MELDCKFQMATACRLVTIGSLRPDQQCPIVHAKCVNMRYGPSVLLAILENLTTSVVFLPKWYGEVMSDEDISSRVLLYPIYKGTCLKSNSYVLELQCQQLS
jgi:hypothetical protein